MILGIAIVVVLVLVAIALFPARQRDRDGTKSNVAQPVTRPTNVRLQQLEEEAEAIVSEYQRRCDEVWREELSEKAASMLKPKQTASSRSTKS